MTKISELAQFLEGIAPLHFQESYDNSGLLVGDIHRDITGVIISLDATEEVIDEAIEKNCNVVVSHHPIVFAGLKRFTYSNYIQKAVAKAIKNDIALYAIHTNLDNVAQNGVNTKICEQLGLKNMEILAPKPELMHNDVAVGSGMIGNLDIEMDEPAFLQYIKEKMNVQMIKHTPFLGQNPSKIAVCGGSGRFLLDLAIAKGADVFISADFKYHEYFDANGKIMIADIGHYESEQFTIDLLFELISKNFRNFAAHCTKVQTNPVNYC